MQVWVEHEYNTDLLDSHLAFPILKRLTELGDKQAERVFKEEIARRFRDGTYQVHMFLILEGYLDFLSQEELISGILTPDEANIFFEILTVLEKKGFHFKLVSDFDEDEVRHKYNSNELYYTVKKGHLNSFQIFLDDKTIPLLGLIKNFEQLIILHIYTANLSILEDSYQMPSIKILKIFSEKETVISESFLLKFPYLSSLVIENATIESERPFDSLTDLNYVKLTNIDVVDYLYVPKKFLRKKSLKYYVGNGIRIR